MTNPERPDGAKNARTESEKCEHWKHGYYRPGGPEDGLYCRRCQTPVSDEYTTHNQPGEHTTSPSEFPLEEITEIKGARKLLSRDPEFVKYYNQRDYALEVAAEIVRARKIAGLTQKELAERMGTKQSGIARAENGSALPSLSFLFQVAQALEVDLVIPRFSMVAGGEK